MNDQLNQQTTMRGFIETLANFYDLNTNTPSKMIKQILVTAIQAAINIQDRYVIDAALQAITLRDFLLTFACYYDELNDMLSEKHRLKLVEKIPVLVNTTRCKKIR